MEEENEMHVQNDKHVDTAGVLESSPNLKKCACAIEPDPDSIGARLRQRRRKSSGQDDAEFMGVNDKTSVVTAAVKTIPELKKHAHDAELSADSVGARLRLGWKNGQRP
ncbi:hypothetical protein H0E87_010528 [Populus deltoides]|uniref:Uncharacterized protein n=1 Tax=Populus deltoides TaxID=3696 RepID=A0A8T2YTS7_POPDE|nr:hypothetical protein H0E87_010528 [Populus deltoides]